IALTLLTASLAAAAYAAPSPGFFDFGKFTPADSGREFVEVNVTSNLLSIAARLTEKSEPEVAEVLRGLQRIRVNVIGLDNSNREEVEKRVKTIQSDLNEQGWERVVTAKEKNEDVGVYLKTRGDEAIEGIVVTVFEGKGEAVFINIVGDIKPEKIAKVGEKLNIDPLKKVGQAIEKETK
ncbi:MAG: DUF4252 domain-containing protein, partial [Verrucomicrobiota bacterium]